MAPAQRQGASGSRGRRPPPPRFEHPDQRNYREWAENYPVAVRYAAALLVIVLAFLLIATVVVGMLAPTAPGGTTGPRELLVLASGNVVLFLLVLIVIAVIGMVQLYRRRNGGRAVVVVFSFGTAPTLLLFAWGSEDIEGWFWLAIMAAFALLMGLTMFGGEVRHWFAAPLGTYDGERLGRKPQTPLSIGVAVTLSSIGVALAVSAAPIPFTQVDTLLAHGFTSEQVAIGRQAARGLLALAGLQAFIMAGLVLRSRFARIVALGISVVAVIAGVPLGILVWESVSPNAAGVVVPPVSGGGLMFAVLLTVPASRGWCDRRVLIPALRALPGELKRIGGALRSRYRRIDRRTFWTGAGALSALLMPLWLIVLGAAGQGKLAVWLLVGLVFVLLTVWVVIVLLRGIRIVGLRETRWRAEGLKRLAADPVARWSVGAVIAVVLLVMLNSQYPFLWSSGAPSP